MVRRIALTIAVAFILAIAIEVPGLINYQGKLTNATGQPQQGTFNFIFKIYDVDAGGTEYWSSGTIPVTTDAQGLFNVLLGSETNPVVLPEGPNCYLEITVEGNNLSPRQRIVSNGYSYYAQTAEDANKLGGIAASNYAVLPIETDEIADNAVTTAKIQDGQVQTADIGANQVTLAKLERGTTAGQAIISQGSGADPIWGNPTPGTHTHSGEDITYGTIADARLSSNVMLLNTAQTVYSTKIFTAQQQFTFPGAPFVVGNQTLINNLNADLFDSYHAGNISGQIPVSNGTVCTNLNADLLDGQHASAFLTTASDFGRSGVATDLYEGTTTLTNKYVTLGTAQTINATKTFSAQQQFTFAGAPFTVSNTGLVTNLHADLLDSYHAGNSSAQIPISNGTVCANLNADLLDGIHAVSTGPFILTLNPSFSVFSGIGTTYTTVQRATIPFDFVPQAYNYVRVIGYLMSGSSTYTANYRLMIGATQIYTYSTTNTSYTLFDSGWVSFTKPSSLTTVDNQISASAAGSNVGIGAVTVMFR